MLDFFALRHILEGFLILAWQGDCVFPPLIDALLGTFRLIQEIF